MNISNIQKIGAAVQQELNHALQSMEQAKHTLNECHRVLADVRARATNVDIYSRARLRALIWELEQMFGHKGPYLSAAGQDNSSMRPSSWKRRTAFTWRSVDTTAGAAATAISSRRRWAGGASLSKPRRRWSRASRITAARASFMRRSPTRTASQSLWKLVSGATQMGALAEHYFGTNLEKVRTYPGHREQHVRVPTMTLASLLDSAGLKHVDYCSMDVEGAECSILENFSFRDYDISVFSIEYGASSDTTLMKDILAPAGYRLADVIGGDEIYVRDGLIG